MRRSAAAAACLAVLGSLAPPCAGAAEAGPAVGSAAAVGGAPPLPALHADPNATTVSGLSSGGFMAVQYATAYSASVAGVAVIAAGPYDCVVAEFGSIDHCMTGRPSGARAWQLTRDAAAAGLIDPAGGVSRQRVYLFSGTLDRTVVPAVVDATRDYYLAAGVPGAAIAHVRDVPAGHGFLSASTGTACGRSDPPYVQRCVVRGRPYDQPEAILTQLLGPLAPAATRLSAALRSFDQRPYASASASLAATGRVYVPAACAAATATGPLCRVHVVFHGCRQGVDSIGDAVVDGLGFNRWADTNRVIVLYPQVAAHPGPLPYNPEGCWDWWGSYGPWVYTGPTFMLRTGAQPAAVRAMVDRLTGR